MKCRFIVSWLLTATTILLVGCSLPQDVKMYAQETKVDVRNVEYSFKQEKTEYETWLNSSEAIQFLSTVNRENWSKRYFGEAEASLKVALAQVANEIDPVLKKDSRDDRAKLSSVLNSLQQRVALVRKVLGDYKARRTELETFVARQGELVAQAETSIKDVTELVQAYVTATVAVGKEFPERQQDLATLVLEANKLQNEGKTYLTLVKREVQKSEPDFGIAIDALVDVAKVAQDVKGYTTTQSERLAELGQSYSKTLIDMRVDYFVTIDRFSWNESSDFNTEVVYTYPPVKVDVQTYEIFSNPQWENKNVARKRRGNRNIDVLIDNGAWQQLTIDAWYTIPVRHDSAEYYADTSERYYHKYRIIRGDKVEYTDWVEVNEKTFDSFEDYLGMDLESKPLGYFASEKLTIPAPEGMSYVGNTAYGNWKTESNGSRHWEFYGKFALIRNLIDGHRYSYAEWDDWNRNFRGRKPYYGKDDEDRYGTGGSVTGNSSFYSNSHYFKSYARDYSHSSADSNAVGKHRGSGVAFRGGGPGGGGK